ncbi:MAG TPA: hypothetical protein DCQ04_09150 [Actinobacteria bacterium]|nr:hypothetical protein [Actinomycetota bacterium]
MARLPAAIAAKSQRAVTHAHDAYGRFEGWLEPRPRTAAFVQLVRNVIKSQGETRASLAAAGAAFWLVIAIFPTITAVITIFGLVVDQQDLANALDDLGSQRQGSIGAAISRQIAALSASPTGSLSLGLIVSLAFSLWAVSNGTYNLLRAIRLSYGLGPQTYVTARYRGVVAGLATVFAIGVIALASSEIGAIDANLPGWAKALVAVFIYVPLTLLVVGGFIALLYRYGVSRRTGIFALLPGAVSATIALVLLVTLLSWVFAQFGNDSAVYGVAAGAVSGLIGVYTAIYIVVLGAIINAQWPSELRVANLWPRRKNRKSSG